VTDGLITRIDALAVLSLEERLSALASLGDDVVASLREGRLDATRLGRLRALLVEVVEADVGTGAERTMRLKGGVPRGDADDHEARRSLRRARRVTGQRTRDLRRQFVRPRRRFVLRELNDVTHGTSRYRAGAVKASHGSREVSDPHTL
jgi:hypothetical protein